MVVVVRVAGWGGGREKGGAGVGCVGMGEGGRGGQLTAQNLRTHTSNPILLAWFVTFTESEKVLKCCLSYRHRTNVEFCDFPCEDECHLEPIIGMPGLSSLS